MTDERWRLFVAVPIGKGLRRASWLGSASAPVGELTVSRIELMRSHTGGGSARYENLATINLGVPADV